MATRKQIAAAKHNIRAARQAAARRRTIAKLPKSVRSDLGRQGAAGRGRGGRAGSALEDRNRQQLYDLAMKRNISGRSRMGKWDLIRALRKAG